ncbi:nuclear transport factor 2 family protein [Paenibacillus sp. SC116]|uniref:YybH family protein n=1 Tax=Paenibacillus sp. SC116 TaxID=2968986 RepID=UPI00215B6F79|nr:nuclear transport factor 2 family protein [Paenibacillus sp. SC116]MCR8846150.1 nuclear transport factor 2 family protein [Paenibacillus sp. SC116]
MSSYELALTSYIEATNTHDFNQVRALLHPDALYWFSNESCKTHDEIQRYFDQAWDFVRDEVYAASDVQWIAVSEVQATCLYTYHWEGYIHGQFASGSGRATNVFVRDDHNQWKLIHEHLSGMPNES